MNKELLVSIDVIIITLCSCPSLVSLPLHHVLSALGGEAHTHTHTHTYRERVKPHTHHCFMSYAVSAGESGGVGSSGVLVIVHTSAAHSQHLSCRPLQTSVCVEETQTL